MIDAREIYGWIRDLPIVDWHNHLDWRVLAEDAPLGTLDEVWVRADPYKHRAMRICGERETDITGDGDRWAAWMRTLPRIVGNPLFAWARQELACLGLAPEPYLHGRGANVSLGAWTPSRLLAKFRVEWLSPCVTEFSADAPAAFVGRPFAVVPSLRLNAGDIVTPATLARLAAAGCRVVDVSADDADSLDRAFDTLQPVAAFAAANGWTMLLHLGALRATSARLRAAAGPFGGFAGMRAAVDPALVARFLDRLERTSDLPRTILLSLNPAAHAQLAVLAGSFVGEGLAGKVQLGPAWWWCDHEEGIRDVLEKNAAYGVLSTFVGMTTDSRSLLSFVRHDYFRRILAAWVAEKVAAGAFPDDAALLRPLVEAISYGNAKRMIET